MNANLVDGVVKTRHNSGMYTKQRVRTRFLRWLSFEACEARTLLAVDGMATVLGDANRDGVFNSGDLTLVFQQGQYEDNVSNNSDWEQGDWNGDREFDSTDLVEAFQAGTYSVFESQYPDVLAAELVATGANQYRVSVTLSSPYDTAARYADAWRVMAPDCTVLGVRILAHDHQTEQPFTRSLSGVEIPSDVAEVTIQGRDQVGGWGGTSLTVAVPR